MEVFCRGWFQTRAGESSRAAVVASAALLGTTHLPLFFSDVEIATAVILALSVTALGYVCATASARTASHRPAIAAHVVFNVGGFVRGVIYTNAYRIVTGHMPPA